MRSPPSTARWQVNPKALTVTALDQSRSYGDVNPTFTYAISGLVNGDFLDSSKLTGSPVFSTTAVVSTSGAGVYPITIVKVGSLTYTDPNYTLVNAPLVGGKLTIQTVPLTIALNLNPSYLTRLYGAGEPRSQPGHGHRFSYTGFVNGDTQTST